MLEENDVRRTPHLALLSRSLVSERSAAHFRTNSCCKCTSDTPSPRLLCPTFSLTAASINKMLWNENLSEIPQILERKSNFHLQCYHFMKRNIEFSLLNSCHIVVTVQALTRYFIVNSCNSESSIQLSSELKCYHQFNFNNMMIPNNNNQHKSLLSPIWV